MKIAEWYLLCQTEPECFQKWEAGEGHGQVRQGAPNPPPLLHRAWNFARAVGTYVAGGCQSVSAEEYAARLAICQACPDRCENLCLKCGCYLSLKARWRAMQCPLEKWPTLAPEGANAAQVADDAGP